MKKNFIKMIACALAMSTICSVTTASADYCDHRLSILNEDMSEELKTYILNSSPSQKISDNCGVYSIYYKGLDENGKEMYDFSPVDEDGYYAYPAVGLTIGFDEDGDYIVAGIYDYIVYFYEEGNPTIINSTKIADAGNDNMIYKTIDVVTGEDIVVMANRITFEGNVIARYGDANIDGEVDIRDITTLNQHILKIDELEDYKTIMADVVDDEKIDIKDLAQVKKYLIGIVDKL